MTIATIKTHHQTENQPKKFRSNPLQLIKYTAFKSIIFSSVILVSSLISMASTNAQPPLQLLVKRFIAIKSLSGTVLYQAENSTSTAQVGQRLTEVGDAIITGKQSSATLIIDEGIGTIQVSEKTELLIQRLYKKNAGYVTQLKINGGQVRLKIRPFNNANSKIEVITPAGVSGVRGTEFGVSVLPSGKTGLATLNGMVTLEAQSVMVKVDRGLQSTVIMNEPPSTPSRLINDPSVRLDVIAARDGGRSVQLAGRTDSVNLLLIGETIVETDRTGNFNVVIPLQNDRRLPLLSTTPLGRKQSYVIQVP
jgi:hypothetical protein